MASQGLRHGHPQPEQPQHTDESVQHRFPFRLLSRCQTARRRAMAAKGAGTLAGAGRGTGAWGRGPAAP
ncbi:hypothetical protein SANTM175S_04810 [Streptomyces antimycoticus]